MQLDLVLPDLLLESQQKIFDPLNLPEHSYGNQLLKKMAKKYEHEIIKEMSKLSSSTTAKAVLQEISQNIMGSGTTGLMSSVSSAGSIKLSLWREKQKINPRPSIPKDHSNWMSCEVLKLNTPEPQMEQSFYLTELGSMRRKPTH